MKTINLNNPESSVLIETADNGYILTRFTMMNDGEIYPFASVIESEYVGQIEPDFESVANLLWQILSCLEINNSKHFKKRIEINVVDQRKEVND